jgi:hypothetical protein
MSYSQEFRQEAEAMRALAAIAATPEDREAYARLAMAYEALATTSPTSALVTSGWLNAVAA